MEQYLNAADACFYHVKPFSQWGLIEKYGLFGSLSKGISVLRTKEFPVINSILTLQLGTQEVIEENDFVLIKISQSLNHFMQKEIQPDRVSEWTWPIHNNLLRRNIPANNLELVCRFSVFNWDLIAIEDFKYEKIYKDSELYKSSFNIVYITNDRKYTIDINGKPNFI